MSKKFLSLVLVLSILFGTIVPAYGSSANNKVFKNEVTNQLLDGLDESQYKVDENGVIHILSSDKLEDNLSKIMNIEKLQEKNKYILELKDDKDLKKLDKYQKENKIKVNKNKNKILQIEASNEVIKELEKEDFIYNIELDFEVSLDNFKSLDVGENIINLHSNATGYSGQGIRIAILDSGISKTTSIGNLITESHSFVEDEDDSDYNGHGTNIATVINTVAPNAELINLKVVNKEGKGYFSDIIAAIDWSIDNNIDIINMSFSSGFKSNIMEKVIDKAYANGITLVASAGNGEKILTQYPARYDSVISVGSSDERGVISTFSPSDSKVDILALGENLNIISTDNTLSNVYGTSYAAAIVSASSAILLHKNTKATNDDIKNIIMQTKAFGKNGMLSNHIGLLNLDNAISIINEYVQYNNNVEANDNKSKDQFYEKVYKSITEKNNNKDLMVEINSTFSSPVNVSPNIPILGSISTAGEEDFYRFTANTSGVFEIFTSSSIDTYGHLYNTSGTQLTFDDDSGEGLNFRITYNLVQGTSYIVKVRGYNSSVTGSYTLYINSPGATQDMYEPNNSMTNATTISNNRVLDANIHNTSDVDWYKFDLEYTSNVTINLTNIPTTCDYDIELYDSSNQRINSSTNGGNSSESMSNVLKPGTYYIKIFSYSGSSNNNYRLSVSSNTVSWLAPSGGTWTMTENLDPSDTWWSSVVVEKIFYLGYQEASMLQALRTNYNIWRGFLEGGSQAALVSALMAAAQVTNAVANIFLSGLTAGLYGAMVYLDSYFLAQAIQQSGGSVKIEHLYADSIGQPRDYYVIYGYWTPSTYITHYKYEHGSFANGPVDAKALAR